MTNLKNLIAGAFILTLGAWILFTIGSLVIPQIVSFNSIKLHSDEYVANTDKRNAEFMKKSQIRMCAQKEEMEKLGVNTDHLVKHKCDELKK